VVNLCKNCPKIALPSYLMSVISQENFLLYTAIKCIILTKEIECFILRDNHLMSLHAAKTDDAKYTTSGRKCDEKHIAPQSYASTVPF